MVIRADYNRLGCGLQASANMSDLPGITTHCKKHIPFGIRNPLPDEDGPRLCKIWLLMGLHVLSSDTERSDHVSVNPRDHFVDYTEAELDAVDAMLS